MDETIIYTYKPDTVTHIAEPYGQAGTSTFTLKSASLSSIPGKPMLPVVGLLFRIPDGTVFKKVEAVAKESRFFSGIYNILSAPKPVFEGEPFVFEPDAEIYGRNEFYHEFAAKDAGITEINGLRCVRVEVYPVKWNPHTREAAELTEIELTLHFEKGGDLRQPSAEVVHPLLRNLIIGLEKPGADTLDRILIVTSRYLENAMCEYVLAKSAKFLVDIEYIEDIVPEYEHNRADKLRAFVRAKYRDSPLYALVLGGDTDVIPTKTLISRDDKEYASDGYYAADYDHGDFFPDFLVWRFPASSPFEMVRQCRRAVRYPNDADAKRKSALFTTYWDNTPQGSSYNLNSDYICAYIAQHNTRHLQVSKCYDVQNTKADLTNAINGGKGCINYRGHGDWNKWQSHIGLNCSDVNSQDIQPGHDVAHILSVACNTSAIQRFPQACFGAIWMRTDKAVSFTGASTPSYTTINDDFDKLLWESICDDSNVSSIGEAYFRATIYLLANAQPAAFEFVSHNVSAYLMLGDGAAECP